MLEYDRIDVSKEMTLTKPMVQSSVLIVISGLKF